MCDCVDKEIEYVKKNYPRKNSYYSIENAVFPFKQTYDTVLIQSGNKKQRVSILHKFCPHCGNKLTEE